MSEVTNSVRFVLDGEIVEAQGKRRTTTVLDYLREQLHRTGTKEGCAEGDCGACVVLVGELNAAGTGVDYIPVNSCIQLLPTLDGKSVKTVESLRRSDGALHPVQQQALKIDDAADVPLLQEIRRAQEPTYSLDGEIVVQPVVRTRKGSEFVSPSTLAEVTAYLTRHPQATLLAGSTEIGLQVNKQFARPSHIVYLGNVAELKRVEDTPAAWRIGAQVPLSAVESLVAGAYPDFSEVLRRFGSPPIRSTATLAGNIANGSPIGDSMPCLMALGTTLVLRRGDRQREVLLDQFYTGQKKNVLQPGELIEAVVLPKPRPGQVFRAHKISKRFEQDISATCCALRYELVGGRLKGVRLAYNRLAPSPCRAPKLEALLEGQAPQAVSAAALDAAIAESFVARDGLRATWAYRSLVARNLVLRFLQDAQPASQPALDTAA